MLGDSRSNNKPPIQRTSPQNSFNHSALKSFNHQANLPNSYDDTKTESNKEVPSTLLVTLDPYTTNEVLSVAHGLRHADALVIESRTKSEMMDNNNFIAKKTRTKSYLHPAKGLKDDPATVALIAAFDAALKQFQLNRTAVVKCYVRMEYLHFRKKLLPLVFKVYSVSPNGWSPAEGCNTKSI
jgi:hypothetical protein